MCFSFFVFCCCCCCLGTDFHHSRKIGSTNDVKRKTNNTDNIYVSRPEETESSWIEASITFSACKYSKLAVLVFIRVCVCVCVCRPADQRSLCLCLIIYIDIFIYVTFSFQFSSSPSLALSMALHFSFASFITKFTSRILIKWIDHNTTLYL